MGKDHWVQEIDGQLGQVIGSKEREAVIGRLSAAGDIFDLAELCLELCMVLGAISLLMRIPLGRRLMFGAVVVLGILGCLFCSAAYLTVFANT